METVSQNQEVITPEEGKPQKTFTQEEVNKFVADRLGREAERYKGFDEFKRKAEAYDKMREESLTDLERAESERDEFKKKYEELTAKETARQLREEVAKEQGVDASVLRGNTKEELEAHAAQLRAILGNVRKYPEVKDGGEPPRSSMTKQDIYNIKDERERLAAIKQNIDLFK